MVTYPPPKNRKTFFDARGASIQIFKKFALPRVLLTEIYSTPEGPRPKGAAIGPGPGPALKGPIYALAIPLYPTLYPIDFLPLSIYSRHSAARVRGKGERSMSESNILDSLRKFKAKYAWDKSLVTGQPAPSAQRGQSPLYPDNSIEEFLALSVLVEDAGASPAGVL